MTDDADSRDALAKGAVVLCRVCQIGLALSALALVALSVIANITVVAFGVVVLLAMVMLVGAGVVEFVAVGPLRRWVA